MSILDEIKESFREGSALTRLIYINIGVFIFIHLVGLLSLFGLDIPLAYWLSLPSNFGEVMFRPWSYISYMFLHTGFTHILFNVLYIYWFGKIFLQLFNPRQLLGVYLLGGLSGALLYQIAYNTIPALVNDYPSSILYGASASAMAILFAVAKYSPNFIIHMLIIGEVKLKWVAVAAFLLDLIWIEKRDNIGGHIAHIGGAGFGYLFALLLLGGKDITMKFNRWMDTLVSIFKPKSHLTVTHRRPMTDMEYNSQKVNRQREVDRILEKIKNSGYDSLSSSEKKILFDYSKEQ